MQKNLSKLVVQRHTYDCVLACLAMATGKDYDLMWDQDFINEVEASNGTGKNNLHDRAFEIAGLVSMKDYVSVYCATTNKDTVHTLLWGRRAMIQVASLNHERASHYVYWDGVHVFDPSCKQRYSWLSQLSPEWVTLLPSFETKSVDNHG
jgi:hypothetical protein